MCGLRARADNTVQWCNDEKNGPDLILQPSSIITAHAVLDM